MQSLVEGRAARLTTTALLYWSLYLVAGYTVASVLSLCVVSVCAYLHRKITEVVDDEIEGTHLLSQGTVPSRPSGTYASFCDLKSPLQDNHGFHHKSPRVRRTDQDVVAIAVAEKHPIPFQESSRSAVPAVADELSPQYLSIVAATNPAMEVANQSPPGRSLQQLSLSSPISIHSGKTSPPAAAPVVAPTTPVNLLSPTRVDHNATRSPSHLDEKPSGSVAASTDITTLQADLVTVESSIAQYDTMLAQGPNNKLRRRLEKERRGFEDRRQKLIEEIASQTRPYIPIATSHHIGIPGSNYAIESPRYGDDVISTTIHACHSDPHNTMLSNSFLPPTQSFQQVFHSPVFRGMSGPDTWGSPVVYSHSFLATTSPVPYDSLSPPRSSSNLSTSALATSTPIVPFHLSSTVVPPVFRSLAPPSMLSDSFGARHTPFTSLRKQPHAFTPSPNDPVDEPVHMVAYAPPFVQPASEFTFAVWAFLSTQRDDMHEEASALNPSSAQMSRDVLFPLRRGARAHVTLEVPNGFAVVGGTTTQALTWSGTPTAAQFAILASDDVAIGQVLFKATVVFGASVMHLRAFVVVSGAKRSTRDAAAHDNDHCAMAPLHAELEMLDETYREIPYASLQLKELVGRGYFGDAYRADYNGRDVVVKTIRASELGDTTDHIVKEFRHEAAVLNMFGHHPNIVPFVGASTDFSQPLTLVTEYLPGGNLEDRRSTLSLKQKMQVLVDAAAGFLNIHDGGFIHRDVAARNCLVDANARAKVCDFGMCRRVHNAYGGSCVQEGIGPLKYMAPESLQPPYGFSTKSDAYSFGVLMWETLVEQKPFGAIPPHEAAARVLEGHRLDVSSTAIPPECAALITACFQEDPAKRPSMQAILVALISAQSTVY
ncbi:hypothetical protein DYB32_006407 [Aphanomyces invadans]|uniref:Protein kinase domain-containing protein n=1 Tax=Aphanomyces invadans TaxID=157072 RepID=A0A3R6YWQ9_9STRA|nr:hypothetical protein DYB32_006407 [Aphanomyces invadans]